MAMGRKARQRRQEAIWIAQTDLPRTVAHPFYEQLNRLLEERSFDEWVEQHSSAPGSTRSGWGGRVWRRGGTSVCCSSGILKASTASVASHGGRRTRWRCAVFWGRGWT